MIDKTKQGKKNKESGRAFELKVRRDMESKGYFVSKWANNVEGGIVIPAKHQFNFYSKVMTMGTGFPDFIAYKKVDWLPAGYNVVGVEAKSNGYLDKSEKEKVKILLDIEVFDFILVAYKGDKRGEILYDKYLKGGEIRKCQN